MAEDPVVVRAEARFVSSVQQAQRRMALKIRKAHATLDMRDLDASWPSYTQAIGAAGVETEYDVTTHEALVYFLTVLQQAGLSPQNPPRPRTFNWPRITSIMRLTGPIYLKRLTENGWDEQAALLSSLRRTVQWMDGDLNGEAQQSIYDAGHDANRDAYFAGREELVQGYERIPEAGACRFCLMLAGASRKAPVFNTTPKWKKPHPGCNCDLRPLPVYRTTRVRSAQEIALGQQMYEAIKASRDRALAAAKAA
jgi:hypothetical protein